jgi:hypothetical protein
MRHRTLFLPAFHRSKPCILPLRTRLTIPIPTLSLTTRLHAQTSRKHELADRGAEATQKGIEGLNQRQHHHQHPHPISCHPIQTVQI